MTPHQKVDESRCPVCRVPLLPDTRIEWCRMAGCKETQVRFPTVQQQKALGMGREE